MKNRIAAALLGVGLLIGPAWAQEPEFPLPGGVFGMAREGFTPAQAKDFRERFSYQDLISAGDIAVFHFLNLGMWMETALAARSGEFSELESTSVATLGDTRYSDAEGVLPLRDYMRAPGSGAQGFIVVHHGKVVFEDYPGMRTNDSHVWMSIAKTTTSLVVRILAEEGKIDVQKTMGDYIQGLAGTEWASVRVIDVLDMASGLDIIENQANRENPKSIVSRFNLAAAGEPNADGTFEEQLDVILGAERLGDPGQIFDYSSLNTVMLAILAEAVENRRWNEIFSNKVWGKMTVEGEMEVAFAPDGTPQSHGLIASRLRDLARYGMLYTPSWNNAAREQIVTTEYVEEIQNGGRKDIFLKGELGNRLIDNLFPHSPPTSNHWQWDAIFDDGDFYKGGVYGQGLYVSPDRDLVIGWFSTVMTTDLTQYARQIALDTPADN